MYRSTGFRVDLTRQQADRVGAILVSQRFAYNWAVSRLKADPTLTRYDLQKEFAAMRRAISWLRDVPAIYQYAVLHRARTAADTSNKYGNGNLKYRSRKRPNRAVECEVAPTYVDNHAASLPGLGHVRLAAEQPYQYPDNWLHKARSFRLVDVSPYGDTRTWRLYATYNLPDAEPRTAGLAVGIDRGITNPTVVAKSDGSVACYDTASKFRSNQRWNDRMRRRMSKTSKHSRGYREMQRRRDRRNAKNAASRDYCEWLLAKEVCEGVSVICMERLGLEAMTRRGRGKRGLNRGMRFVRHGEIIRKIMIVAERLGIKVTQVDPAGTSRECSACRGVGERDGERFECPACHRVMNADGNAACNIMHRGTGINVPAGEGIALERREASGRTRNPPEWVMADPDCWRRTVAGRRENQARNRPATSSAGKHLGRYAYVTRVYPSI